MKKVLIVVLALILALTTVFASVSTASAAPNKLHVEITNLAVGTISYDYSWKHLNVTSWLVEISRIPIGSTNVDKLYEQRFFATTFGSDKITVESSGLLNFSDSR